MFGARLNLGCAIRSAMKNIEEKLAVWVCCLLVRLVCGALTTPSGCKGPPSRTSWRSCVCVCVCERVSV